jgi:hypothetical protein
VPECGKKGWISYKKKGITSRREKEEELNM